MLITEYKEIGETIAEFSDRIKLKHKAEYAAICGKLDPMARGYTTILLDDSRKKMDNYLNTIKTYRFDLVFGIKTTSDDILGKILNFTKECDHSKILDYILNTIPNQTSQYFHPYSAKRITINKQRKPLHYFSNKGMVTESNLPEKKVKIYRMSVSDIKSIEYDIYKKRILERIDKISGLNRNIFNIDDVKECWKNLDFTKSLYYVSFEMTVSSGYYVRMIPYYIYRDLSIPSHIYDINRIIT